ncbi:DNA-3-methyladenine glycosylase [Candidatus Kaiserbacteria bacterium]|nr:DNA-3-methyladenine glycosylase [Candidatus Kaiserbacteria bacterium]
MKKILLSSFFNRKTLLVAEELIGKFLVRRVRGKEKALMICETEAYDGFKDKASHAHRGKTTRNEIMFREAGHIYVYFTYGMHYMLNIVTGNKDYPAAVLLRAVEGVSGPGRLTKKLRIDKKLNGKFLGRKTGLWIEDRGVTIQKKLIRRTPRIGIRYAEEWAKKPYRFVMKGKN